MMISFVEEDKVFQSRAASIIIHDNKVLFQKVNDNNNLWFIPGGRVEFNESAEQTIDRELVEEFGVSAIRKELVWIVENFVQFSNKHIHEVAWFFIVTLSNDELIFDQINVFSGVEPGFINKWIPLDEIDNYHIVPEFVVPELKRMDTSAGIKHIISRGVR
jgi:ADP-ribose pyrophosphatase YjhB (NUDIX family)